MGALLVPSAARVSNDKSKLMDDLKEKAPQIMKQWKAAEKAMNSLNKQLVACLNVKTKAIKPHMKARFMFLKACILNKRWEVQCLGQVLTGIQDIVTVMNVHTAYNTMSEADTKKNVERILASLEHELNKKLMNVSSGNELASRLGATMSQTNRMDQHIDARIDTKESLNETPSAQSESATSNNEAFIDELLGSADDLDSLDTEDQDQADNEALFDKDVLNNLGLGKDDSDKEDDSDDEKEAVSEQKVVPEKPAVSVKWPVLHRAGHVAYGRNGRKPSGSSSAVTVGVDEPIKFRTKNKKKPAEVL